jgi:hypothetical protein
MYNAWTFAATRLEVRLDAVEASVVFVAAKLRQTLMEGTAIREPSVRLAGPRSRNVGVVLDERPEIAPTLRLALQEIRSALDATGLAAAAALELASVAVLARGPEHREQWSRERLRQETADGAELSSVLRWPRASRMWATLAESVEDAVRTADAHARLDEALRRLR